MRHYFTAFALLSFATSALAQDVSVPSVSTASPGGYANPLKLDTDRYKRSEANKSKRTSAPFGLCHDRALTNAQRTTLEAGYRQRARAREMDGYNWLKAQCGANSAWTISRAVQRRDGKR